MGSKRHILTEAGGIPLAVMLTAANVHDSMVFEELVDSVEPIKGRHGRPRKRPDKLHADKGYDYARCRRFLRRRGIKARIARQRHREQRAIRSLALGSGTDFLLDGLLPQVDDPLRAESRHPRSLPAIGLCPHLFQSAKERVLKCPLSERLA